MGVTSYTLTQYIIECDNCGENICCPDSMVEGVHSKQQAIRWAKMHQTIHGILCDKCYKEKRNK